MAPRLKRIWPMVPWSAPAWSIDSLLRSCQWLAKWGDRTTERRNCRVIFCMRLADQSKKQQIPRCAGDERHRKGRAEATHYEIVAAVPLQLKKKQIPRFARDDNVRVVQV